VALSKLSDTGSSSVSSSSVGDKILSIEHKHCLVFLYWTRSRNTKFSPVKYRTPGNPKFILKKQWAIWI